MRASPLSARFGGCRRCGRARISHAIPLPDSARIWRRHSAAPRARRTTGGRMDRLTVGDTTCSRVEETVDTSFTAEGFFPAYDFEVMRPHLSWLAPRYFIPARGALVFSMHAWVVKTGGHTVIIDTCIGNDKDRMPR